MSGDSLEKDTKSTELESVSENNKVKFFAHQEALKITKKLGKACNGKTQKAATEMIREILKIIRENDISCETALLIIPEIHKSVLRSSTIDPIYEII